MPARVDHVVIAVPDLEQATARWAAAGLPAVPGGEHPGGTRNELVRGPEPAYVELIAAPPGAAGPWAERVRGRHGPLSWAIAVDDLDGCRHALVDAGFTPAGIVDGSRTTPAGDAVRWRLCQVGPLPFDPDLPFLIEWIDPMPAGPESGPVLEWLQVVSADPERLVELLELVGLPRDRSIDDASWWSFGEYRSLTVTVVRGPSQVAHASFTVSRSAAAAAATLDGLAVQTRPDVRAHPAYAVLRAADRHFAQRPDPTPGWTPPHPHRMPLEEEYSRCPDPGKYRIVAERADAWVAALSALGLGETEELAPSALPREGDDPWLRVTRVRPSRPGAAPLLIARRGFGGASENLVAIGAGEPAGLLDPGLPDCGCDACDDGSQSLLAALDQAVLVVLGGGVLQVRSGDREVTRTFDGWSGSGSLERGAPERWLAGDHPPGAAVLAGAPWL